MSAKPTPEELTAYVLGSLDAALRARVDAAVAADAALAAEVAKLRRTAGYVAQNLSRDPKLRLSPDRRAALEAALRRQLAANPEPAPAWWRAALRPYVMGPVAAVALVILVVWVGGTPKATTPVAEQAERVMQAPASVPAEEPAMAPVPAAAPPAAPPPVATREKTDAPLRAGGARLRVAEAPAAAPERKAEVASAPPPQLAEGYGEASGGGAANKEADVVSETAPAPAAAAPPVQSLERAAKAASSDYGRTPAKEMGPASLSIRVTRGEGVTLDTLALEKRLARVVNQEQRVEAGPLSFRIDVQRRGELCQVTVEQGEGATKRVARRTVACDFEAVLEAAATSIRKLVP